MDSPISATDAARSFSDLVNRVSYRGESFLVERGGEPVCRIVPAGPVRCTVADLVRVLEAAPKPDASFGEDIEALARTQPKVPKAPWGR